MDHVLSGALGVVHPGRPEARDGQDHVEAVIPYIVAISGVGLVLEDRVGDGGVSVNLLEGDLPLVVALDAIEGDHGVQRALKALLPRVVERALKLPVAVDQKVPRHLFRRDGQVHRQAIGLGVPVGGTAVLLACEALGSDVEPLVGAVVGGEQLEDVETDALLRRVVARDRDIRAVPALAPGGGVLLEQYRIALGPCGGQRGHRPLFELRLREVPGSHHRHHLLKFRAAPGQDALGEPGSHIAGTDLPLGHDRAQILRVHRRAGGETRHAEGVIFGLDGDEAAVLRLPLRLHVPEQFLVIGVLVVHVAVKVGRQHHLGRESRRHPVADGEDPSIDDRQKPLAFQAQFTLRMFDHHLAAQRAGLHVQLALKLEDGQFGEVNLHAVHCHVDADHVDGVDDLAKILRVAVFPPADARLVREPDAAQVCTPVAVPGVLLLKVAAHAHRAVADGGQRFGKAHRLRMESFLNQFPGMNFKKRHVRPPQFHDLTAFYHVRAISSTARSV